MIVNLQTNGWEIIYHRAHALLAAQIGGYWNFQDASHRLYETIAAISHHDDLEKEWEGSHLTEVGAPLDFTLDQKTCVDDMRHHIEDALYRGRWVAMLISMHLCFLNQGNPDPSVDAFLHEQYEYQAQWRDELDVTKDEAAAAYDFMRWCDRLSLILCQRKVPVGGQQLEITKGPDGQTYNIQSLESGYLTVTPWPFSKDKFQVTVDACYLSQLQFETNEQLVDALKNAPREILIWTFKHAD